MDGEGWPSRQEGGEQDAVDEGEMIGDDDRALARFGVVLAAAQLGAIEQEEEQLEQEFENIFG